jgi:hypothetical protein
VAFVGFGLEGGVEDDLLQVRDLVDVLVAAALEELGDDLLEVVLLQVRERLPFAC